MNGVYNFNDDADKVLWLKTCFQPHGRAMLDRWRSQDEKVIGKKQAQEKMMRLIQQAKGELNE